MYLQITNYSEYENIIINSPKRTIEEYNNKTKQKDEFITKGDMFSIYKYNLRKCYNIYPILDDVNQKKYL